MSDSDGLSIPQFDGPPVADAGRIRTVLVTAPSLATHRTRVCGELLDVADPEETNLLFVTYTSRPADKLAVVEEYLDGDPANVVVVDVAAGRSNYPDADGVGVEMVSGGDLTELGVEITDRLSSWSSTDRRTVVGFDSVTALAQYADPSVVYEFLHTLSGELVDADAFGHFHLNPQAVDDQLVQQLLPIFDAVVRRDAETGELAFDHTG
ncbi:MAG: hypothetical protein ABEJ82_03370 [Haloplanus sp.]